MMDEVSVADLKFDPNNARLHSRKNMEAIEESLRRNGFGRSVLLAKDGTILAGNATIEVAAQAGFDDVIVVESDGTKIVAVKRTDLDPNDAMAIGLAIADNAAATYAEWNAEQLKILVDAGHQLKPYFDQEELKHLLTKAKGIREQDERPTELADTAMTNLGDVWRCGDHLLMCADATDHLAAEKLLRIGQTDKAQLLVTSPPYGVGKEYADNSKEDGLQDWRTLTIGWIKAWSSCASLAAINLGDLRVGPNGREVHTYGELVQMCNDVNWPLIATRIWVKKQPVWFNGPYYASSYRPVDDFEYIGLFGNATYKQRVDAEEEWRFRGCWPLASVTKNDDHPAKFPTEIPERCMLLFSDHGDTVIDPFMGSGTTMVVAEQLGRTCLGVELSPRYVDLAVRRWEALTGETAERIHQES